MWHGGSPVRLWLARFGRSAAGRSRPGCCSSSAASWRWAPRSSRRSSRPSGSRGAWCSAGIAELVSAFSTSENRVWKVLLGLLYLAVGLYMLFQPGVGLVALALTLAWLFLVQGVISIFGSLQLRPLPGWGWWLFDGIITLLLAFLIFSGWPHDSVRILAHHGRRQPDHQRRQPPRPAPRRESRVELRRPARAAGRAPARPAARRSASPSSATTAPLHDRRAVAARALHEPAALRRQVEDHLRRREREARRGRSRSRRPSCPGASTPRSCRP